MSWVYGIGKFTKNIKSMVGYWPSVWLPLAWNYLTPILTMVNYNMLMKKYTWKITLTCLTNREYFCFIVVCTDNPAMLNN